VRSANYSQFSKQFLKQRAVPSRTTQAGVGTTIAQLSLSLSVQGLNWSFVNNSRRISLTTTWQPVRTHRYTQQQNSAQKPSKLSFQPAHNTIICILLWVAILWVANLTFVGRLSFPVNIHKREINTNVWRIFVWAQSSHFLIKTTSQITFYAL